MSELMPTETKEEWNRVCSSYKEMKEYILQLLEHPESTEEQMMQGALMLRAARIRLEEARVKLSEAYPRYTISLKGITVQIHRAQSTTTTV